MNPANDPASLVIPEQLKELLRRMHTKNLHFTEDSSSHHWSISHSKSEWSGYHDEDDIYIMTTTVTDREPLLESGEFRIVNFVPSNRDLWQDKLPGFLITDYFETYKSGEAWYEGTDRSYIRLDGPKPLWIISETVHTR